MSPGRLRLARPPRWLIVYFVLAAVNLLMVSAGVIFGARMLGSYRRAIETSQHMAELRGEFLRLGELAADVDAPGNDVFVSHDPVAEAKRLDAAFAAFARASTALHARLASSPDGRLMGDQLRRADASMEELMRHARAVLANVERRPEKAAEQMASMDRSFHDVNVAQRSAQAAISARQHTFFEEQLRTTRRLEWLELSLAVAAFVLVLVMLYYGRHISAGLEERVAARTQELERVTETARAGEERFRFVARATQAMIWEWDPSADVVWHSDAVMGITGEPLAERTSGWWFERIHPDDLPAFNASLATVVDGPRAHYDVEYRIRRVDGTWAEVHDRGFAIRDEAGALQRVVGSVMDITDQKNAERAQAEQQSFLRQVIDTIPNFVFVKDRAGRFTLVNHAVADMYGSTTAELIGKTDADFSSNTAEIEHFRRKDLEVMDSLAELFIPEEPVTDATGAVRWLQTVKRPIRNASGGADHMLGISTDITARKEAKRALSLLASIVETSDDAISSVGFDGTILSWNSGAERLFGFSAAEAIGANILLLRPEIDKEQRAAFLASIENSAGVRRVEVAMRRKDGERVIIALTISPLLDEQGDAKGASLIARDITESKLAEERLKRSESNLAEAQRIASVGSWELQLATGRIYWSDQTYRQLGYEPRSVASTFDTFMARVHPDDRGVVTAALDANADSTEPFAYTLRYLYDDGSISTFQVRAQYDRDEYGVATRLRGTSQDITAQQEIEAELRRARQEAESASHAKSDFLANMSHEIRTPMNGVLGMIELSLDSTLSPEVRDYLRTAQTSADALLEIINDILDFSKIEAGHLELDRTRFHLGESLGDTISALALRAHEKNIELAMEIAPDVPEALVGDVGRLRQVLVNLIGNAIKFTMQGEVVLQISHVETIGTRSTLRFSVRDTGVGIPLEKQHIIFDSFQQADSSTTREYGGTGLGLAISSRLVELMGGSIGVESVEGQGSTFSFTVSFEQAPHADGPVTVADDVDLRGVSILVVDDSPTNLRIVEQMVTRWGMQCTTAAGGQEGLDAAQRAAEAGRPYSLVLTDADMPGMDGFALVSALRQHVDLRAATVVMLSSARHREEVSRCRELDVRLYITKPVSGTRLHDAIRQALGRADPSAIGVPSRAAPGVQPLSILLAEDNPVNQKLAINVLQRAGHVVEVVDTGVAAVERTAAQRFDVVLMDVQMPVMGGIEATRQIRERERLSGGRVPIIALTARAMQGDREACMSAGMDGYMSKPLRATELIATIAELSGSDAHPAAGELTAPAAHASLDVPKLLDLVGHDRALLGELVALFVDDASARLAVMRKALDDHDAATLRFAAHALKGASGSLTAHRVADIALAVEEHAAKNELAGMSARLAALDTEVSRALEHLDALLEREAWH